MYFESSKITRKVSKQFFTSVYMLACETFLVKKRVCGMCDPLLTPEPYSSALEINRLTRYCYYAPAVGGH